MWPNPQLPADLVTFTGEILNWEIYLLCSVAVKSDETSHRSSFHVLLYLDSSICRKYFMQDCRRQTMINIRKWYYVKSVRIRSYSGPYFPASGLNTERYGVSLRIQPECGKIRTKITPNMDTLYGNDSITFHPNFLFFVLIWENMFKLKNWLEQHVRFDKNWCFTTTQWQNQD